MNALYEFTRLLKVEGLTAVAHRLQAKAMVRFYGHIRPVPTLVKLAKQYMDVQYISAAKYLALIILQKHAANIEARHILAQVAEKESQWIDVIKWCKQLIVDDSHHAAEHLHRCASAHISLGQYKEGVALLDHLLTITSVSLTVLTQKALAIAKISDDGFVNTVTHIEALAQHVVPETCIKFSQKFTQMQLNDQANKWLNKVTGAPGLSSSEKMSIAKLLYASGDYDSARLLLDALLKSANFQLASFEVDEYMGHICFSKKQFREASLRYKAALAKGGHHLPIYKRLIISYLNLGENKNALEIFISADKLFSRHIELLPIHPRVLIMNKKRRLAKKKIQKFAKNPLHPFSLWQEMGNHIDKSNRPNISLSFWRLAVKKFPTDVRSRLKFIQKQYQTNQPVKDIVAEANVLAKISPHQHYGLLVIGNAYRRDKELDKAKSLYLQGCKNFPQHVAFWIGLLRCCIEADETHETAKHFERASHHFNVGLTDDSIADNRKQKADFASLLSVMELHDDSDELYETILSDQTDNEVIRLHYVKSLMQRGCYGRAFYHADQLSKRNSTKDEVEKIILKCKRAIFYAKINFESLSESVIKTLVMPECSLDWLYENSPRAYVYDPKGTVLNVSSTLRPGGAERQVVYTMNGLNITPNGFSQIRLLVETLDPNINADFFAPGIFNSKQAIIEFRHSFTHANVTKVLNQDPGAEIFLDYLKTLPEDVRKFALPLFIEFCLRRPSVVHLWQDRLGVSGALAAICAGVPRILIGTRSTHPSTRRRYRHYLKPIYKFLSDGYADRCIFINNSRNGAADYEQWLNLPSGQIKVVHNGLDINALYIAANTLHHSKIRKSLGISKNAFVLGSVGRFTSDKRPELWVKTALEIIKYQPETHFIMVGDGALLKSITRTINESGHKNQFHVVGTKRPVEPWIAAMDMVMLTSNREGLPNVLLEAQCLGIPVATTNVGGAPEALIEGRTGIVFQSDDHVVLAQNVLTFVNNKQTFASSSRRSKAWVEENFSIGKMVEATLKHYV